MSGSGGGISPRGFSRGHHSLLEGAGSFEVSVLKASELFKAINDQAVLLDSLGHRNIRSWETGRKEMVPAAAGYQVFLDLNL